MSKVFLLSPHLHAFSVCSWTRASGSKEGWAFGTSRGAASHLLVSGWDLEPHGERSAEGDLEAVEVVGGGCEGQGGETPSYPLQGAVGLEAAIVQVCVSGLLAGSSADVHVQHELQAFHYLRGQRVGPGHWVQDMVREGVSWGPPPSLQAWALVPTGGGEGRPQSPGLSP